MAVEILQKVPFEVLLGLSVVERQTSPLFCCWAICQSSAVVKETQLLPQLSLESIPLWLQWNVALECSLLLERHLPYLAWLMLNLNSMVLL